MALLCALIAVCRAYCFRVRASHRLNQASATIAVGFFQAAAFIGAYAVAASCVTRCVKL